MEKIALIMAGGRGERFWPRSRKNMPKQFLCLTDDGKTMIQLTVERILPLIKRENIYIATNTEYKGLVSLQLPQIPEENILCEPVGRNTAPCIGLAAAYLQKKHGDAIMLVLPADHIIKYEEMFLDTLNSACEAAEEGNNLVTIGIMPSFPATGYGYIKFKPKKELIGSCSAYRVESFVEKPDLNKAKEYVSQGSYLWNSGMFVWKVSSILENIEKYLPELSGSLKRIGDSIGTAEHQAVLSREFYEIKSVSIDYGIMEKAENIFTLPSNFWWDDVGSWLAMGRINTTNEYGNVVSGNVITIDVHDSIIQGSRKLLTVLGVDNLIVVDTDDALLICNKDSEQDIKKVLENLRICNHEEYI